MANKVLTKFELDNNTYTALHKIKLSGVPYVTRATTSGELDLSPIFPAVSAADAGKALKINSEGTVLEWGTVSSGKDWEVNVSTDQKFIAHKPLIVADHTSTASGDSFTGTKIGNSTNVASGEYSLAEGSSTTASGNNSHTEGQSSSASKTAAHAEGSNTVASGNYSHAEGIYTTASGTSSHAEGFGLSSSRVTASGQGSHAEGYATQATGIYSHAEGDHTIAKIASQHVQGKYNADNSSAADIVGWGTSAAKKNIEVLTTSGELHLAKEVYINSPNADASGGLKLVPALTQVGDVLKIKTMPTSTSAGELEWGAGGGGSGTTYTFTSNTTTGKGQFTVTPASGSAQTVTTLYGTVGSTTNPVYLSSDTITASDVHISRYSATEGTGKGEQVTLAYAPSTHSTVSHYVPTFNWLGHWDGRYGGDSATNASNLQFNNKGYVVGTGWSTNTVGRVIDASVPQTQQNVYINAGVATAQDTAILQDVTRANGAFPLLLGERSLTPTALTTAKIGLKSNGGVDQYTLRWNPSTRKIVVMSATTNGELYEFGLEKVVEF